MEETKIMICECHSLEHQMQFWHDEEDDCLYAEIHLITHRGFFRRLWYAIKYIFGYKSRFGAWDEFIFGDNNRQDLLNFLTNKVNIKASIIE